ncbi:retinoblastoma-related protein isoform X2 [Punica granatum]|uniref:Retinoblastoma-related protein isoform X2 n=2 Tax=Punica granatum TaxID=22663 RepID=A0A6P8CVM2_PUNGR|nr:retinoblastoma-related protein isoform X2 [Punica granatum]
MSPASSTSKPSLTASMDSPADSGEIDAVESRFTEFCKNVLSLDESTFSQSVKLFRETKHLMLSNLSTVGSITAEEAERYWFSFVLYCVRRLSGRSSEDEHTESKDDGFTLCQILRLANLNLVDFFKELPQYLIKARAILDHMYGADWKSKLETKEMQANFVHLNLLSQYYKRTYRELFHANEDKQSALVSTTELVNDYQRFGWLLFLAVRGHAFSRFKDLVSCVNGLVSVLVILIIHVPTRFRKFNVCDDPRFAMKTDEGVDVVGSLCHRHDTTEQMVKETLGSANKLIEDLLKKIPCAASECKAENLENINTEGMIYFEGLMEESSISSSLNTLEKDYEDTIRNKDELDARVFANEEDSLLGSGSLSGGAIDIPCAKRKFDSLASPAKTITSPLSPHRSPASHVNGIIGGTNSRMASTPVSTAMTTARWLRNVISPLPSKPSAELMRFLTLCERDVTHDVVRRAHIILEAIFPSTALGDRSVTGGLQSANLMDNVWAEQRRLEACKLYYRVLEAMCRAEAQILHSHNLTSLLTNERFHRCMLACSAELVLATHKTVTMLFPAVLERTGITAFDLSKVIESFIRHEESLPRELRRHLNSLEERLLESMVWEKGSSMYNSLIVARPSLSAEINRLGLLAEPMPSLDAIAMHINFSTVGLPASPSGQKHEGSPGHNGEIRSPKRLCTDFRSVLVERNSFTSPVKDRLLAFSNMKSKLPPPPLQSAFASPTRPNPGGGGETCAETAINIFFSKITKLAAVRISGMFERLQLSQQMKESIYRLFQQILNQRTGLFFNRHIDQIILCCFYLMAKISRINLTFRDIICNYRKQPHCKPQVFRTVFVDGSSARRNGRTRHEHVDIITFYNETFVPSVKPLLADLGPVGADTKPNQAPDAGTANNAHCPGSPKISQFPSLPDMSPKKVSPAHNVYVSPMRSSKMDASISHSAKSYYACVGESTHAYQSPSKDLAVINNRLNGSTRKLRGALNFDDVDVGLVSDSMVANSLYLQNGNRVSPPAAPKSENPEI